MPGAAVSGGGAIAAAPTVSRDFAAHCRWGTVEQLTDGVERLTAGELARDLFPFCRRQCQPCSPSWPWRNAALSADGRVNDALARRSATAISRRDSPRRHRCHSSFLWTHDILDQRTPMRPPITKWCCVDGLNPPYLCGRNGPFESGAPGRLHPFPRPRWLCGPRSLQPSGLDLSRPGQGRPELRCVPARRREPRLVFCCAVRQLVETVEEVLRIRALSG